MEEEDFPPEGFFGILAEDETPPPSFEEELKKRFLAHYYDPKCFCMLCILERQERNSFSQGIALGDNNTQDIPKWANALRNELMLTDGCKSATDKCCECRPYRDNPKRAGPYSWKPRDTAETSGYGYNNLKPRKIRIKSGKTLYQRCEHCQRQHAENLVTHLAVEESVFEEQNKIASTPAILNKQDFREALKEARRSRDTLLLTTHQQQQELAALKAKVRELESSIASVPRSALIEALVKQGMQKCSSQLLDELSKVKKIFQEVLADAEKKAMVINSLVAQQEIFRLQMTMVEDAILTLPDQDLFLAAKAHFESVAEEQEKMK